MWKASPIPKQNKNISLYKFSSLNILYISYELKLIISPSVFISLKFFLFISFLKFSKYLFSLFDKYSKGKLFKNDKISFSLFSTDIKSFDILLSSSNIAFISFIILFSLFFFSIDSIKHFKHANEANKILFPIPILIVILNFFSIWAFNSFKKSLIPLLKYFSLLLIIYDVKSIKYSSLDSSAISTYLS